MVLKLLSLCGKVNIRIVNDTPQKEIMKRDLL